MISSSHLRASTIGTLALVLLAAGLATAPEPADAHSMYPLEPVLGQRFVNAGGFVSLGLYVNRGPSNVDWTIHTELGLSGGDRLQNVWFYYRLYDRGLIVPPAPTNEIGRYSVPVRDWVQAGPNVFGGTITSHAGGNMDLVLEIYNNADIYGQEFNYYARARHP